MIKKLLYPLMLLPMLFMTSCSDSREKILEDYLDTGEEMLELLQAYDSGKVSEGEVIEELGKLKEIGEELSERVKALEEKEGEEASMMSDDFNENEKELMDEMMGLGMRIEAVKESLRKSGKWTPAIERAMNR